jgi:hypothetical protein
MKHYYARVMEVILRAEALGARRLANGTYLIGHTPHVAPEAYLHVTYPALDDAQIDAIDQAIGRPLPDQLRDFYRYSNGMDLFGCTLSIFGLRTKFERTGDAAWQPFSIVAPNVTERPHDAEEPLVFFGCYESDGSQLAMSSQSRVVYRCRARTAQTIGQWPSFEDMLVAEVTRLSYLFDETGRRTTAHG